MLYDKVPHFRVVAIGPRLPWVGQNARVDVDYLAVPTEEEALAATWEHIRMACESERLAFDEDQWLIQSVTLVGGN